jgi:hypothetical protein
MNEFLKYVLLFVVLLIAGFYIYQMVMFLSPATDMFAPK